MATRIDDITAQIEEALEEAYQRGLQDGRKEMRESLLKAAGVTVNVPTAEVTVKSPPSKVETERAPRGRAEQLIDRILAQSPGLQGVELENRVLEIDDRVARKSVGNTLRRLKGDKYLKKGQKWFLIAEGEKEAAEQGANQNSAASPDQAYKGGSIWTRPRS